jgi:hypothetical protein
MHGSGVADGQAILPGDYTFTSADQGVHAFTNGVTLKTAGSQTVTATDTNNSSITGSATLTVNPAAASLLIVSGFPSPTTAGGAHNFTVTARDAYGNIATGYRGTVHFTSSDAQATLPANYTFTSSDNGTHTFSATLKTAGSQSLTATDTSHGSITGTQSGITVNPAAASHLSISAPSSVKSGTPFSITVTALDPYGNTATGYRGTIHFRSSDRHATLPPNYTYTSSDNGVHTFSGVILRRIGSNTISAADTLHGSITGTVTINVTSTPTSGAPGSSLVVLGASSSPAAPPASPAPTDLSAASGAQTSLATGGWRWERTNKRSRAE